MKRSKHWKLLRFRSTSFHDGVPHTLFSRESFGHNSNSPVLFRQTLVQKRHLEREEELQSELEELGENLETELGEEVVYLMFIFVLVVILMFLLVFFMFSLVFVLSMLVLVVLVVKLVIFMVVIILVLVMFTVVLLMFMVLVLAIFMAVFPIFKMALVLYMSSDATLSKSQGWAK